MIWFQAMQMATCYACLSVQPDGKIVVGGAFTQVNGQPRPYLARLSAAGNSGYDICSNDNGGRYQFTPLALQVDGRLVVVAPLHGCVNGVRQRERNHIARFNSGGSLDAGWNPDANGTVYAIAPYPARRQGPYRWRVLHSWWPATRPYRSSEQ